MIDFIIFIIFIGGIIIYYTTYNIIFLILAIIAFVTMHCIHKQEIVDEKTGVIRDFINLFKRNDKNG